MTGQLDTSFLDKIAELPDFAGKTVVIYDGECPFCSRYVAYQGVKASVGALELVDARVRPDLVRAFDAAGAPLDQGMALVLAGKVYYGPDCLNRLALLSSESGLFNRVNALIFRSPTLSRVLYPMLRGGRNLVLRLLGRSRLSGD